MKQTSRYVLFAVIFAAFFCGAVAETTPAPKPPEAAKAPDPVATATEPLQKRIKELEEQINQLNKAFQALSGQRDYLAKQVLDSQLQTQLLQQAAQEAQKKAPDTPPAK